MLLTAEIKRQNLMKTATKALVIKEQTIGESDRLITLLSAEHGLIRAFVRRAKLAKSRSASATSLFAYGDFSLYRGKDAYTVDDVTPIEVFLICEKISKGLRWLNILLNFLLKSGRRNSRVKNFCG